MWRHFQFKLSKKDTKKLSPPSLAAGTIFEGLPLAVAIAAGTIFEGLQLAVVVLPPLRLGSPMIHVCIHSCSIARVNLASIALRVILWRIHLAHQGRIVLMKHGILLVLLDVHGVGILLHHSTVESLRWRPWGNLRLSTPCLSGSGGMVRCRGVRVCVW